MVISAEAPVAAASASSAGPVGDGDTQSISVAGPVYQYRTLCDRAADGAVCSGAKNSCPGPGQYRVAVWSAPTPGGQWKDTTQTVCAGGPPDGAVTTTRPPNDAEVGQAAADALATLPIPAPELTVNPGPAITQLPTILNTQPQAAHDEAVTVLGVPVTVHLTPHWHWDTGAGAGAFDSTTSGVPYDGTDPVDHPEHYVSWTFRQRGPTTITVSVSWTATGTRNDTGDPVAIPGQTVRTGTQQVQVLEARAHLTG